MKIIDLKITVLNLKDRTSAQSTHSM